MYCSNVLRSDGSDGAAGDIAGLGSFSVGHAQPGAEYTPPRTSADASATPTIEFFGLILVVITIVILLEKRFAPGDTAPIPTEGTPQPPALTYCLVINKARA